MDHHVQQTSGNTSAKGKPGQDTYRRRAEALALAGIVEPVLFIPLQGGLDKRFKGLSLRGRAVLGPAGRTLEIGVRELLSPAHSRGDHEKPADFELRHHGMMLPGAHDPISLYRVGDVVGDVPHWGGEQTFLLGQFTFHLFQLEAVLPKHGWLLTMRVDTDNASS